MGIFRSCINTMSGPGSRAIRYTVGLVFIIGGVIQGGAAWGLALVGYVLMHLAATDTCVLRRLIGESARKHPDPAPHCAIKPGPVFDL
ncbi:DUF2892 domain-containing protein [Smaragdicoccus niigatensis]|uniref:YgaP family membrane protein n=1 Tax=Smaragdicoccus niigatensis TaxID=359359 RepID=UPI0009DBAB50|nr:DUF2892 domain-containing protein [Smaragdicoccus niigatensis]